MTKDEQKVFNKLYQSCLSATAAYKILKSIKIDNELPGYEMCERNLNNAIKLGEDMYEPFNREDE